MFAYETKDMLPIYIVLGHVNHEGDQLLDVFTDERKALRLGAGSANHFDRVDVEKWFVADGKKSLLDIQYERQFWRGADYSEILNAPNE